MARLVLLSEGQEKKEIKINGLVSIGRAFDNILCIEDKKVSRYQAIIEKHADGYYLSDLGSINGTTIGDEKIASNRKLKDGEVIVIGGVGKVEFYADQALSGQLANPQTPSTPQPEMPASDASLETTLPESKLPTAAATNPAPRRSPGLMLAFIALPVLLIAGVGVMIFANADNKNPNGQGVNGQGLNGQLSNQATGDVASNNGDGLNTGDSTSLATNKNGSTNNDSTTVIMQTNTTGDRPTTISLEEIRSMCQQLAANISGKNDYIFDRDFLFQVDRLTRDYLDVSVDVRACRNIAIHCNAKNLPVTLALALAMQRSKFKENKNPVAQLIREDAAIGYFMLPKPIAKGYVNNEDELNNSQRASEIGVEYLKEVVDKFRFGKEDFAFAIAYYGTEIGSIGEGTIRLDETFADARTRQNFWKIINSRQLPLPAKASENVARFFAAGIVGENPRRFSLPRNPLSQFN